MPGPKLKCRKCKTVIQSKHRHDFVWCECRSIFVDGGSDYFRRGGNIEDMEEVLEGNSEEEL